MSSITDPIEVLTQLPTTMMWRGEFDPVIQYIRNDVVISPITQVTYICVTVSAAFGQDPSTNVNDWFPFTGGINTVHTLQFGEGLENIGTATQPIVENTGVLTVRAGKDVFISGTLQNRVINSTAVAGFVEGLGIIVTGQEVVNDGIRNIGTGGGLYLETPPPNAKLSQTNILSVTAGNGIINSGTAQDPVLENDWVRTITLNNIVNGGTPNDPILTSNNVELIVGGGDSSVQISGPTSNPIIGCRGQIKQLQVCLLASMVPVGWPTNPAPPLAQINFTCISPYLNAILAADIANGGIRFNLSSICVRVSGGYPNGSGQGFIMALDSTTSSMCVIGGLSTNNVSYIYPFDMSFGSYTVAIATLRAAGLRALTGFAFQPVSPSVSSGTQIWSLLSYSAIYATVQRG